MTAINGDWNIDIVEDRPPSMSKKAMKYFQRDRETKSSGVYGCKNGSISSMAVIMRNHTKLLLSLYIDKATSSKEASEQVYKVAVLYNISLR